MRKIIKSGNEVNFAVEPNMYEETHAAWEIKLDEVISFQSDGEYRIRASSLEIEAFPISCDSLIYPCLHP